MKKEILNEYDVAKDMLKTLREYDSSRNDMIELSNEERKIEEDKFRETVSPRVQFTVFNIYPQDNNAVFGGKFTDLNGLEWQFSLEDDNGIYITGKNLQLTPSVLQTLQRLKNVSGS